MWSFSLSLLVIFCATVGGRQSTRLERLLNGFSNTTGQSVGEYARQKMASLHMLRDRLEQQKRRLKEDNKQSNSSFMVVGSVGGDDGLSTATSRGTTPFLTKLPTFELHSGDPKLNVSSLAEVRKSSSTGTWDPIANTLSSKYSRTGFLSKLLPREDVLQNLMRIRGKMDPGLRNYLTTKYNSFLNNLISYSDNFGVSPNVLNSMKIPLQFDPRWGLIQSLLEKSNVESFLSSLPEFSNALDHQSSDSIESRIESRSDDQDLVTDQEPEKAAKHPNLVISHTARRTRPRKGEASPDRTGYENGFDQYGLYGSDSYDSPLSYGKGYDDYYTPTKSYGSGNGGSSSGHGYNDNGYGGSSNKGYKSKGYSSSYSSYGTAKGHGGGHGGGSGSYGGGGGGTGYGSNNGMMDPFSILGGLAFLTYLGLLLQQSLNRTATGRSFPDFDNNYRQPVQLTELLPLKDMKLQRTSMHTRHARSLRRRLVQNTVRELEYIWNEIGKLEQIRIPYCRRVQLCKVFLDIRNKPDLLNIFKDALQDQEEDERFVNKLLQTNDVSRTLECKKRSRELRLKNFKGCELTSTKN